MVPHVPHFGELQLVCLIEGFSKGMASANWTHSLLETKWGTKPAPKVQMAIEAGCDDRPYDNLQWVPQKCKMQENS